MTETLREKFMKKIAKNPRFKEAEKSGKAFVIVGARQRYSEAEREIITHLQKCYGRSLTQEEIYLSLEQAKAIHGDNLEG